MCRSCKLKKKKFFQILIVKKNLEIIHFFFLQDKKKELISFYEEEERRIRMKSVGNIRFIGELFKQGMLTKNIMHFCINHLLQFRDEENLECLCKLLTTIGKKLESKDVCIFIFFLIT